jgi:hypothetical protein
MVVRAHRDVGSVGDYDICTAAKEIVGVGASEQARQSRSTKRRAEGSTSLPAVVHAAGRP